MDTSPKTSGGTRRGSILFIALLMMIAASSIALYAVNDTMDARHVNLREESMANALSAAEYGAELAISEIANGFTSVPGSEYPYNPEFNTITGDWVLGAEEGATTLFTDASNTTDPEQRRIRGVFNDHEFRVRVRSVRRAYDPDVDVVGDLADMTKPIPPGWNMPDWLEKREEFVPGRTIMGEYEDIYEITSTARPRGTTLDARTFSEPVVQTLVAYRYDSPRGSLADSATLIMENPERLAVTGRYTPAIDHMGKPIFTGGGVGRLSVRSGGAYAAPGGGTPIGSLSGPVSPLKEVYNIHVSGEDHNIRKLNIPRVVSSRISTPLRLGTNEARFFKALGTYWANGYLTLNFIDILDGNPYDALKYKEIQVRTTSDNKPGSAQSTFTAMVPIANPQRPYEYGGGSGYYSAAQLEQLRNTTGKEIPANIAMWSEFSDNRTVDTYLLGGKQSQTVHYQKIPYSLRHKIKGASGKLSSGIMTAQTNSNDKFSIVLGAFEDLPNLYINMAQGPAGCDRTNPSTWSQMYVGQYTKERRRTNAANDSIPLLRLPGATEKIRPQTIQTLLNSADEMLVREYEYTFRLGSGANAVEETVYFAYPATGTIYYYMHAETGHIVFVPSNNYGPPGGNDAERKKWGQRRSLAWKAEAWKGNYTWAKAQLENNGTYVLTASPNVTRKIASTFLNGGGQPYSTAEVLTQERGKTCTPRQFFWQELVGYSLVKDWSNARYGEPALIDDGLGYPQNGESNPTSRRTIPYEDGNGQRIIVGFDEAYQRSPKFKSDPARWNPNQPNASLRNPDGPSYLVDAWDPIPVRNEVGGLDYKSTMSDFLFKKKFIKDQGLASEEELERDSLCLYIGYEDQVEWTADYNYTDMIFSIYIAPTTEKIVRDENNISPTSLQWWERDELEGLTGGKSHPAVGVNMQIDSAGMAPGDVRAAHLSRFRHSEEEADGENSVRRNIWTMHGNATEEVIDFPRAVFEYDMIDGKKYNSGRLDLNDENVKRFLDLADKGKAPVFYYTRSDLIDYIQQFVKDGDPGQEEKWFNPATVDWRYELAAFEIQEAVNNNAYTFLPVDKAYGFFAGEGGRDDRWGDRNEENATRTERASLEVRNANSDEVGALHISPGAFSIRRLAGGIIGSSVESVPAVRTDGFSRMSGAAVEEEPLGFIAGEIRHDRDAYADPALSGLVSDGAGVPLRSELLTFPEIIDEGGTYRTGHIKDFLVTPSPSTATDRASLDAAAAEAVRKCYVDLFTSSEYDIYDKRDVQNVYGVKEERYSIGFHRTGKEFEYRADNAQDRMEIVALGVRGWNPFRTASGGPAHIAKEEFGDPAAPSYGVSTNYDVDGGAAPTFVFDKPIDGAGAMVVNGNLHIKSTFAYYGVLVVLGDLIIEPAVHENEYVFDPNGFPYDEWGHPIYRDSPNATSWHYKCVIHNAAGRIPTDEDGNERTNPVPARQNVPRGELIVQGTLAVKGRITTLKKSVPNADSSLPDTVVTGQLNVYRNRQATDDAMSVVSRGTPDVRRLSWHHSDMLRDEILDVTNIWSDKADSAE